MSERPSTIRITKARRYLSDADSREEAQQMAPDGVEVQEGDQGGFFYQTGSDDADADDATDDDEWEPVTEDMGYGDFDGKEILVNGEVYTASSYHSMHDFVGVEEDLSGDEPGYATDGGMFEGIEPGAIDGIRDTPDEETDTDDADDPATEEEDDYELAEWDDPPENLAALMDGQEVLVETDDGYEAVTINWASDDIASGFDEWGEPFDIHSTDEIAGVQGEGHDSRLTPDETDDPQEILQSIPFYGDREQRVKDTARENVNNLKDEDMALRILDHIDQFESMPGRAHVDTASGTDKDRAPFNIGSSGRSDTVNHEFGHLTMDAYGYGIGSMAAREAMTQYDSQEDNFIQLDPDNDDYHLTQQEDIDAPPEVERLADAINQGWSRLQDGGDENAEQLNIRSNYSATNAHEFMAELHETLQRSTMFLPDGEVSWFDHHPELLPAYTDVFEPSESQKAVISYLHEDRGDDSPFDENPYPDHYPEDADKQWKAHIAAQMVWKARRYVDHPGEVPADYDAQEGPQGGIYYETDESSEAAGADGYGRDELREIAGDSFYVDTDVSDDDITSTTAGPFIVDRGNGPERVTGAGALPAEVANDDDNLPDVPEDGELLYWDTALNSVPATDVDVLAAINPKRDEHGHLIDPEQVEIEQPDSHPDFPTRGFTQRKKDEIADHHDGDWWENRDAAKDLKQMGLNRVYDAYGKGEGSTGGDVWGVLESWKRKGYDMQSELWDAAMAMTGKETVPEHLADYSRHGIGNTDPEVRQALCDLIRLSRETVREEFGETVTVSRAIGGHTFRQYAKETDDGVEIKPNVMESWAKDRDGAEEWAEFQSTDSGVRFGNRETGPDYVVVEKEFDVEDVAFHGGIALGATNETYKELTMAPQDETYTISDENIDRSNLLSEDDLPDYMKQDDVPRLPWHASQWMYSQSPIAGERVMADTKTKLFTALDRRITQVAKGRRYVDHPDEVPAEYEVQEGPQGGIYYETEDGDNEEQVEDDPGAAAAEPGVEEPPTFDGPPNTGNNEPLSRDQIHQLLEPGDEVWALGPDGLVSGEVAHATEYDDAAWSGLGVIPDDGGPEDGFSIYPMGEVYGYAGGDDEGDISVEDVEIGDEIWFEGNWGDDQAQAVVTDIQEIDGRTKLYAQTEDGQTYIITNDGSSGYELLEVVDDDEAETLTWDDIEVGDEIEAREPVTGDGGRAEVLEVRGDEAKIKWESGGDRWIPQEWFQGFVDDTGDSDGVDLMNDDLTGMKIRFDTGQDALVVEGEGTGLQVEMLTGANEGERIYGVNRSNLEEVIDTGDDSHDIPDAYVQGPDTDPDTDPTEWIQANAYVDQHLLVYDRRNEEIVDAYVDTISANGNARANITGGDGVQSLRVGMSNRFDVVGAEPWESLERDEKEQATERIFGNATKRDIDDSTTKRVKRALFDYDQGPTKGTDALVNAKDPDVMRRVMESISYLKNKVSRASCGGRRGSGEYRMKVSPTEDPSTVAHELGHGIATTFRYDYDNEHFKDENDELIEYAPFTLSHNYTNYSDTGAWGGYIDWDLSEDSPFFDPEEYMFSLWEDSDSAEKRAVGFDEFQDEVDEAVEERYKTRYEEQMEEWQALDYKSIPDDTDGNVEYAITNASVGDVLQIRVPDWDAGRDENGDPLEYTTDYATLKDWEGAQLKTDPEEAEEGDIVTYVDDETGNEYTGEVTAVSVRDGEVLMNVETQPTGDSERQNGSTVGVSSDSDSRHFEFAGFQGTGDDEVTGLTLERAGERGEWSWRVDDGDLVSSYDSQLLGFADSGDDDNSDSQGWDGGGGAEREEPETITDHLAQRWDGFNPDAESPEEKMENLARAVNRSWYKQAKVHEAAKDDPDHRPTRTSVSIKTGYSGTNAHETMAQTHEVMQSPSQSGHAEDLFDEHPWLVLAYMDMWEPTEAVLEELGELLEELGIEL